MIYKILFIIVITIVYGGLFWGLPLIGLWYYSILVYLAIIGILHGAISLITGISFLIVWLGEKAGWG